MPPPYAFVELIGEWKDMWIFNCLQNLKYSGIKAIYEPKMNRKP